MIIHSDVAAGAILTNSTAETVLKSTVLPAYALREGSKYRVKALVDAFDTNSTDTLRLRVRVGPTTLTGTVVADSTAIDVADADQGVIAVDLHVRTEGAAGVIVALSEVVLGVPGTATVRAGGAGVKTAIDTSADLRVEVTGEWSVANAGNQCRCELLVIEEVGSI